MHKFKILLALLLLISLAARPSAGLAAPRPEGGIRIISYQVEGFAVPQVRGMADRVLQAKINGELWAAIAQNHDPAHYTPLSGEFEVSFYNGTLLGIHFSGITYTRRAAHPNKLDFGVHIDLATGKRYELSDLFKPGTDCETLIKDLCRTHEAAYRLTAPGKGRWWTWDGWAYDHFLSSWSGTRFLLAADSVRVYDSLNFATGYFSGYRVPYVDLTAAIDTGGPLWRALTSRAPMQIAVEPEEFDLDDFIVRTYDVKPGDEANWVVIVMGEPKTKTAVPEGTHYAYDDLDIIVGAAGKIVNILTDSRKVSTRRWVAPGSPLRFVTERYGEPLVSSSGDYDLYEYAYSPYKTGAFVLRFAVKKGTETVSYIGWRITEP